MILNLILSVVPEGATAFREAWRVLHSGGRPADMKIERDEPSLLHGQYRIVLLSKT